MMDSSSRRVFVRALGRAVDEPDNFLAWLDKTICLKEADLVDFSIYDAGWLDGERQGYKRGWDKRGSLAGGLKARPRKARKRAAA
jgi:hypothetical protein